MFINEIILSINRGFRKKNHLRTCHDTILWYCKSHHTFHPQYEPYKKETYQKQVKLKGKERADELQKRGSEISDVWTANVGEDTPSKYPTQKIVRILSRIISLTT